MIVGIVSDTHGHLSTQAAEALAGVDFILCAGDVERDSVLWDLQAIAPTTCVRGNNDFTAGLQALPSIVSPRIAGVRFLMVHDVHDAGHVADDVDVVVHGHTHIPRNEVIGNVRYINPGSTSRPRGGHDASIARVIIENGAVKHVEFIEVS